MIEKLNPKALRDTLKKHPKVMITMHRGPDGDAIGSSLGFARILDSLGADCLVVAPDDYPDFLKWLPGSDSVMIFDNDPEKVKSAMADRELIFCLDFNHPGRLAHLKDHVVKAGKPVMVIDHHRDPVPFADRYYVDSDASSTAELIYRLASEMEVVESIDREAATCLYTGLVTDTGSFRFSSVTPEVLKIAADLMSRGVDHTLIYDKVYDTSSLDRLRLKGYALYERTKLIGDSGGAYIYLTADDLERFKYRRGDTEGLVNYALSLKGVHVAGFFYERDGYVKISLRSKGEVDVNLVASAYFNGGGHKNAAGGRSDESLSSTIEKFEKIAKSGFKIPAVNQ